MSLSLPTFRLFFSEDYKESAPWFQRFIQNLNLFTDPVYSLLDRNLSIATNLNEEIYSFQITAGAAAINNTIIFSTKKISGAPVGVVIAQCLPVASVPTAVGNPVTLDWYWNGTGVQILAIYGLTSGTAYNVTVRIF